MIRLAEIERLNSLKAFEKYLSRCHHGDYEKLIFNINATINKLLQTDLKKAGRFLRGVQNLQKYLPERCQPRFLAIEARCDHWQGKSGSALRKYEKAIRLLTGFRDFESAARARIALVDVYLYKGQYQKALQVGKRAMTYFNRKGDIRAARVMSNIGNVYHRMDKNKLALRYYERARALFAPQGGVPLAVLDYNMANVYANLNQLDNAEQLYLRAADVYRSNNMELVAAKAEYSLAYIYFLNDKYTKALTVFENVLDTFSALGDKKAAATTKLDLAEMNNHLNQFCSAVVLADDAISDFKKLGLRYERAKAAYFTAESLIGLGDDKMALQSLRKSALLFRHEENFLWQGMIELMRCRLQLKKENYNRALGFASNAYQKLKTSGDQRRLTDAEIALAQSNLGIGRSRQAIRMGGKLLQKPLAGYQRHAILDLLGNYYFGRGELETALDYYKKAIDVVEMRLLHLYPDEIKFFFAADKYATYIRAAECLRLMDRTKDSFLQHSQAMAMMNQSQPSRRLIRKKVPQPILDQYDQLRATLKKLNRPPDSSERRVIGAPNLHRIEQRLWATERKARSYIYPRDETFASRKKEIQDYTKMLHSGEILVSYTEFSDRVGAFCVTDKETTYVPLEVSYSQMRSSIRQLHFLMEKSIYSPFQADSCRKAIDGYLDGISDALIKPLDLLKEAQTIIFLVDDIFIQIPFPALKNVSAHLKDTHDIRIAVNPNNLKVRGGSLIQLNEKRSSIFASSSPGLPMVDSEATLLGKLFPDSHLYKGNKATCRQLKRELALSDGIIHIAAHASRASENPLFSRILMSDGPFFPFDLFDSGIKAQLVVLSGCQTAAPGIYYGNTFSLAKIFYQCGARFVLASLWSISDKVSAKFMYEFYRSLKDNGNIFMAYREALNSIKSGTDNPAYWSPFIMLGL